MKNWATLALLCVLLLEQAYADEAIEEVTEPPQPLSLDFEQQVLRSMFPQFANTATEMSNTMMSVRVHRRKLEAFRRDWLEGLNLKLRAQCERLERFSAYSDRQLAQREISEREHLGRKSFVIIEQARCAYENYSNSSFWKLYDRYLNEYRRELRELKKIESRCLSQESCREGQN